MAYEALQTFNLRYAIRRAGGLWQQITAWVTVPVDPLSPRCYRAGDEENIAAIERALDSGEDEAEVVIGVVGRRDTFARRVQRATDDKEDWLSLWSDLLNTDVLAVEKWDVRRVFRGNRR